MHFRTAIMEVQIMTFCFERKKPVRNQVFDTGQSHRVTESLRLEKISNFIWSNCSPTADTACKTMSLKPSPLFTYIHFFLSWSETSAMQALSLLKPKRDPNCKSSLISNCVPCLCQHMHFICKYISCFTPTERLRRFSYSLHQ